MSTTSAGSILAERLVHYKQKQGYVASNTSIIIPQVQPIIIKPSMPSWDDLQEKLQHVINLPGLWITVRELYDQGYGAELATAAEIALATYKKGPCHLFAKMVSKKSGNWATRTLKMVQETWDVRRNALQVMN